MIWMLIAVADLRLGRWILKWYYDHEFDKQCVFFTMYFIDDGLQKYILIHMGFTTATLPWKRSNIIATIRYIYNSGAFVVQMIWICRKRSNFNFTSSPTWFYIRLCRWAHANQGGFPWNWWKFTLNPTLFGRGLEVFYSGSWVSHSCKRLDLRLKISQIVINFCCCQCCQSLQ